MKKLFQSVLLVLLMFQIQLLAQPEKDIHEEFRTLQKKSWKEVFADNGSGDWQQQWFLDGQRATVKNMDDGMLFSAGPIAYDNASHAVLWTKKSFKGHLKIEYDFTRMDDINKFVNIIYIQATGVGSGPYNKDISTWKELRVIPYMNTYFKNMNLLHVSYAAFPMEDNPENTDYVRARRYPVLPGQNFNSSTMIKGDYYDTDLFEPGVNYHITIIKHSNDLFMQVEGHEKSKLFYWDTSEFKKIEEGRIGFRHMWTRCSKYANIKIYQN